MTFIVNIVSMYGAVISRYFVSEWSKAIDYLIPDPTELR